MKKTKISKAQQEVWDWKEQAYEELKQIPKAERVAYVMDKVKDTIARIKQKKQPTASP